MSRVIYMLRDLDEKHVSGHNRLRVEADEYEKKLEAFAAALANHEEQLKSASKRTTDVSSLRFTPATVATIVFICASIVGGSYASTWGLRDDVNKLQAMIAQQDDLKKLETKIIDERAARMEKDVGEIKAQQTMQDLRIINLRETVLTNQKR